MYTPTNRTLAALLCATTILMAQVPAPKPPPGFGPRMDLPQNQPQPPVAQQPQPGAPAAAAPAPQPAGGGTGGLQLENASLTAVIDILARQLKINYILDPRVKGGIILNTYGETKALSNRELLDMILRINGFAMVQVGDIYRIVPMADAARLPIKPSINQKDLPDSEQIVLNLIFLKYANVDELTKLLDPFMGENSKTWSYAPANLLLILDSARSMRRTMELISLFDNDSFAGGRVRLFETQHARPSDLAKEIDNIFKGISLNEKQSPIKFIPVDRINTIITVAANPSAFGEVEKWIKKLDTPVKITAGAIDNYVYRVKYGRADLLAMSIMMLYGGGYGMGMGGYGMGGYGMGMGMSGMMGGGGMYGGGGYGSTLGAGTMSPTALGMYGAGPGVSMQYNTGAGTGYGAAPGAVQSGNIPPVGGGMDATGTFLGSQMGYGAQGRVPRVVPNAMDNSLIIQGTPAEYEGILKILRQLDIAPRQVLIEAKIYEVSLTGAFANGIAAFIQDKTKPGASAPSLPTRALQGFLTNGTVGLTAGALVGQSRELLAFMSSQDMESRSKVISAPSVIATDSIAATINVGTEVPTLASQAVTGVQSSGSSLFANTIQNRQSGVTLAITARINPSGIVTLIVNQEVSAPQGPSSGGIQSPSFSKRTINTQVTVEDGDTIAIGGIINESNTYSSAGIPFLHRLPVLGAAFGSRSYGKERTELIVFMTPRVIYDTNEISEASEELKGRLRRLRKYIRD
ncbi:MAG: type II secretion system secretin GspD [Acidobacteria bacterium]|nr:type II secretion system secretin GspD [Acidobacteriota bacterium]